MMGIKLRMSMAILTKNHGALPKTANGEAVGGRLDHGAVILQAEYTFSILDLVKHSHITLPPSFVKPFSTFLSLPPIQNCGTRIVGIVLEGFFCLYDVTFFNFDGK